MFLIISVYSILWVALIIVAAKTGNMKILRNIALCIIIVGAVFVISAIWASGNIKDLQKDYYGLSKPNYEATVEEYKQYQKEVEQYNSKVNKIKSQCRYVTLYSWPDIDELKIITGNTDILE